MAEKARTTISPKCSQDFCDNCGACLACYGSGTCLGSKTGQHRWVVYRDEDSVVVQPLNDLSKDPMVRR